LSFVVTQELFNSIHEQVLNSYRSFWENTNLFEVAVIPSKIIDLDFNTDDLRKLSVKKYRLSQTGAI
jgi:hypothetical protein